MFDFFETAPIVYAMGFLDVDYKVTVTVTHETEMGMTTTVLNVPILGDNSKQTLEINIEFVKQIKVDMARSGKSNTVVVTPISVS